MIFRFDWVAQGFQGVMRLSDSDLAEAYRSRTYRRPHSRPLVLKTRRHTGNDTPPQSKTFTCSRKIWQEIGGAPEIQGVLCSTQAEKRG